MLARIRGKSNGLRNWFGRKQVVSQTLSGMIGLLNWLAIASVLLHFIILQTKRMDCRLESVISGPHIGSCIRTLNG